MMIYLIMIYEAKISVQNQRKDAIELTKIVPVLFFSNSWIHLLFLGCGIVLYTISFKS